jgi:hypothetical protein
MAAADRERLRARFRAEARAMRPSASSEEVDRYVRFAETSLSVGKSLRAACPATSMQRA